MAKKFGEIFNCSSDENLLLKLGTILINKDPFTSILDKDSLIEIEKIYLTSKKAKSFYKNPTALPYKEYKENINFLMEIINNLIKEKNQILDIFIKINSERKVICYFIFNIIFLFIFFLIKGVKNYCSKINSENL